MNGDVKTVLVVAASGALLFSVTSVFFSEGASLVPLKKRVRDSAVGFVVLFVLIALVASGAVFFHGPGMTDEGADRYEKASGGR